MDIVMYCTTIYILRSVQIKGRYKKKIVITYKKILIMEFGNYSKGLIFDTYSKILNMLLCHCCH